MKQLTDTEIGAFFDNLKNADKSSAQRAVASAILTNHQPEIESYVVRYERSWRLGYRRWGHELRGMVQYYGEAPDGFSFNELDGSLRAPSDTVCPEARARRVNAFRRKKDPSSRLVRRARLIAGIVLHVLKLGSVALVIWTAYEMLQSCGEIAGERVNRLERLIYYTPVDDTLIPVGENVTVSNTPFDFRKPKAIGRDLGQKKTNIQLTHGAGYDHNWVLKRPNDNSMAFAARVTEPKSGRVMEIYTQEPGLQLSSTERMSRCSGVPS